MTSASLHSDKLLYLDICVFPHLPSWFASILWLNLDQGIKCAMESFIYIVRFKGKNNIPSVPLVKIMSARSSVQCFGIEGLSLLFLNDTALKPWSNGE